MSRPFALRSYGGMRMTLRMNIRTVVCGILVVLCMATSSFAVLGKTFNQYKQELGEPSPIPHAENAPDMAKGSSIHQFEKDDWIIRVLFVNNWSRGILCMKKEKDKHGHPKELTDAETEWLLKYVGGSKKWKKPAALKVQKRDDGSLFAGDPASGVYELGPKSRFQVGDILPLEFQFGTLRYHTIHYEMTAENDGRMFVARTSRFSEAHVKTKYGFSVKEALAPPAEKEKAAPRADLQLKKDREWVAKNMVEVEAMAKTIYAEYAKIMGKKRGLKKAIGYLEGWDAVIEAKVDGEYIRIKYKGDMTGAVDIGPEKK